MVTCKRDITLTLSLSKLPGHIPPLYSEAEMLIIEERELNKCISYFYPPAWKNVTITIFHIQTIPYIQDG